MEVFFFFLHTFDKPQHVLPISVFKQPSRSSKKIHNFGKRSNSIKRNPNAPVVKNNWLYKQVQDSTEG